MSTPSPTQLASIATFFAEVGMLKRLPRNGMRMVGLSGEGEGTVGQHVIRAAQIGYVLAHLEGANPEKTASILLFHDNGEIRVGDQHKVAARYFDTHQAETEALREQTTRLPNELAVRIMGFFQEFEHKSTLEGKVAKDADYLETAITAFEIYQQGGSKSLLDWVKNVRQALQTKSAQQLLAIIEKTDDFSSTWWQGLKKVKI